MTSTMPPLRQFVIFAAATTLLALPACFLSIGVYFMCSPGPINWFDLILFAAWLTPAAVLRVSPVLGGFALVAPVFFFSTKRRQLVVPLLAAMAGVLSAPLTTLHSPHISPPLAAISMGFGWMTVSVLALIVSSRPKMTDDPTTPTGHPHGPRSDESQ